MKGCAVLMMEASLQKRASWAGKPCSLAPVPRKPRWSSVLAPSIRNVFRPTFRLEDPTVNQTDKPLPLPVELTLYRAPLLCCGLCFAKEPWGTLKDYSVLPRLQPQNLGPPPEQSGVLNIWVGTPKRNKWTQKT